MRPIRFVGFAVVTGGLLIAGCQTLRQMAHPEVRFKDLKVKKLDFEGITLAAHLGVKNPLPVNIPVAKTEYQFMVEGKPFIQGTEDRQTIVGSGQESVIELPVRFQWRTLYRTVKSLAKQDSFAYTLKGKMHLRLGEQQSVAVPFERAGKLPVVRMPKLEMQDARIMHAGTDFVEIAAQVGVHNPNPFPLFITAVKGEAMVGDIRGIRLHSGEEIDIPGKEARPITLRMRIDLRDLGLAAVRMFMGNQLPSFLLQGKLIGQLPIKELSNPTVTVPLKLEGKLRK